MIALPTTEPPRRGEDRLREVLAPGAPGVPAADDQEAVANMQPGQLVRERDVLREGAVTAARVEPHVRALPPKPPRHADGVVPRAVVVEPRSALPEDGENRIGELVAGPAFDDAELTGVV